MKSSSGWFREGELSKIAWSSSWSVGDDLLDREHQELVGLINRLADLERNEASDPMGYRDCLAELVLYAENHFRHEEERLVEVGFPDVDGHRIGHLRFRRQLSILISETERAFPDLQAFLSGWLKEHILREDQDYAAYLKVKPR